MKTDENTVLEYGKEIPQEMVIEETINDKGLLLKPKETVLACSKEIISMPTGYFGFIQTKGTLARFFITVHCCDAQVDPGYEGKLTFEICNFGNVAVKIRPGTLVFCT
jgi:dCTP deaminase